MKDDIAIKVENLSKCYQIYDQPRHRLMQMLWRGHKQFYREFWALKDISFEIRKGETVGIIGRNGSGKSTLLQMICGTLNPTSGSIVTRGRIAALLELGSGFNPEFTGRENVFMNASILGLNQDQTAAKYDEIVAFSEIGEFIDQPVKSYSSGMVMRLAFAVAIQIDPDILVVDEALSVGDERFQRKCFSRIEAIRARGATILFVSHSAGQIVQLCDRALLLDAGELLEEGAPKRVVGHYQKLLYAPMELESSLREAIRRGQSEAGQEPLESRSAAEPQVFGSKTPGEYYDPHLIPTSKLSYASHGVNIRSPEVTTLDGLRVNQLRVDGTYRYSYLVEFEVPASAVRFGMLIKSVTGVELGGAATSRASGDLLDFVAAGSRVKIGFTFQCRLNPGTYFLNAGVLGEVNQAETFLHRIIDAAMIRVLPDPLSAQTGPVCLDCKAVLDIEAHESWMGPE